MLIEVIDKDLVFTESKEYALTSVVSDHGIYEKTSIEDSMESYGTCRKLDGIWYRLKLILNSRSNALKIMNILDEDEIDHKRLQEDENETKIC